MKSKSNFVTLLFTIGCIILIMKVPTLINSAFALFKLYTGFTIPLYYDKSDWFNLISVALPSGIAYIVFKQSEVQRIENEKSQDRLEIINNKLLSLEVKSKKGYFLPRIVMKPFEEGKSMPYPHMLKEYISLDNVGNDITYLQEIKVTINGKHRIIEQVNNTCFLDTEPLNSYSLELKLTEDELKQFQIDVEIEILMKNSRGYEYIQVLYIGFQNQDGIGFISNFNMKFQDIN